MPYNVEFTTQKINYSEEGGTQFYILLVQMPQGNLTFIPVFAVNPFIAGILAKRICKRVLVTVSMRELFGIMRETGLERKGEAG